ncbi:uncharacterized protein ISCGN_006482 [Ixodes scapularis]
MNPSDGDSAAGHVSGNAIKDQPPQDSRPRRKKTLSQKALLNYEANRDEQRQKLDCVWERIANDLREVEQATNAETQQAATGRIRKEYGRYQALSEPYAAYLSGINAEQSQLELALQKTADRDRARAVQKALMDTGKTPDRATKSRDSEHANSEHSSKSAGPRLHGSRRSGGSTRSDHSIATTTSTAATRARAEAAAARTRASFTRKEVAMKLERARLEEKEKKAAAANDRRKAELDAELQILQLEREAAAMEVQAEILQAAAEQHGGEHRSDRTISDVSEVRAQRTVDYVHNQAAVHNGSNERPAEQVAPELSGVLKYLVRRDLVSTGLVKFDDHPENYRVWKATFKSMVQTLEVMANEELDLLVNWLGRESSVYAKRLRSVHVDNPAAGLEIVWDRLEDCYGLPEVIEDALFKRIGSFPKFSDKETHKLRELGDLLLELEAAKADPHLTGLSYLDTARGANPIAEKLPHRLQETWISKGSRYKEDHHVSFPPFSFFSKFVRDQARMRNDPSVAFGTTGSTFPRFRKNEKVTAREGFRNTPVSVHATDVTPEAVDHYSPATAERMEDPNRQCPLHKKPHPLRKCRVFREKPLQERKSLLKQFGICFRCCSFTNHLARDCKVVIKCDDCDSTEHTRALHPDSSKPLSSSLRQDPEDDTIHHGLSPDVSSKCTEVCGEGYGGRSCSKICLVSVCHSSTPQKAVRMYAILDDQSNRSLARTEFFNLFDVQGESSPYTLKTCAGTAETTGRRASGFLLASIDGSVKLPLPTLIECNQMINNRNEIPTPDAARHHPHLKAIESLIPPLDAEAQILLLLGRDILRVHKEKFTGPVNPTQHVPHTQGVPIKDYSVEETTDTLFQTTKDDDQPAPLVEDRKFLKIMNNEVFKDESCSWVAPLPFRVPRPRLPNNKELAQSRLSSLRRALQKRPEMKEHFATFMDKMFRNGHAEVAPPPREEEECWYLPIFGVYHPRKPSETRVVFDSSAQFKGTSLNNVLLTGPDVTNSLLGVLIRFRKDLFAVTVDIQQMFYCFLVREDHRNYLRFLWFRNNDIHDKVVEYRMRVHVFGNSPSPAVATYGLRKTAQEGEEEFGKDTREFVEKDFYVDDGLKSLPTADGVIDLLKRTQQMLAVCNLRLHKIVSNSSRVMEAFPKEDHTKDLRGLDLSHDIPPIQRSLGICWDVKRDVFTFRVPVQDTPFTRRGVLSMVNSVYDPFGFVAPVTIQGKSLLRELVTETCEWDSPLPENKRKEWKNWKDSLQAFEQLEIDVTRHLRLSHLANALAYRRRLGSKAKEVRLWVDLGHSCVEGTAQQKEVHIFSDASTKAVAAVAYLRTTDSDGQLSVERLSLAKNLVIRSVQLEAYANELECLSQGRGVQKSSPLWKLDPCIDDKGLLRVGGRLNSAQLSQEERRPLIIPGKHHVALLLVRYYHEQIKHQGRHLTEGAVRSAGFWIIGAKRCIASYIHGCVMCCRLRGRQLDQKMADLPVDRLSTEPAFTHVGVDVFGLWNVSARRTRGGEASSKRWAVLFTCMSIRAVHVEVIESMDASSLINALRRFFAISGPAKQLRSDCGTNFVGACSELNLRTSGLDNDKVQAFLSSQNCSWVFNPPHSSHFGGAWERMIGISRRILDSMLLEHRPSRLSHEVLVTFLAEVSAIINARPLVPVSMDPECWDILSPSTLLTQKVGGDTLPPCEFNVKDLYRSQWHQMQWLADSFWHRWRRGFLTTLQSRRKWQDSRRDLKEGDIVLLRDKQVHRNEWPMGAIVNTFPCAEGKVRKVEIKTATRGELKTFLRPVTETVLLVSRED